MPEKSGAVFESVPTNAHLRWNRSETNTPHAPVIIGNEITASRVGLLRRGSLLSGGKQGFPDPCRFTHVFTFHGGVDTFCFIRCELRTKQNVFDFALRQLWTAHF